MKIKNVIQQWIFALAISAASANVSAFDAGEVIGFDAGIIECVGGGVYPDCAFGTTVNAGSYFAMDFNGSGTIDDNEKTPIQVGDDGGIIIGTTQPGSSHSGCPDGTEVSKIDAPWCFFANTGMHQTTNVPVTDNGDGTLDFSGWGVHWNGTPVPLAGIASLSCSSIPCHSNDTYVIDMSTVVSSGAFFGVTYAVHLEKGAITDPMSTISLNVAGGATQECLQTGGSNVSVNATVTVPDGDMVNYIDWSVDGVPIFGDTLMTDFMSLGSHTVTATVISVYGSTAEASVNVLVQDTQAPSIEAQFIDAATGLPVTSASSKDKVDILAKATDVCDAAPAVESIVGAKVSDGDRLTVARKGGVVSLAVDNIDLSVHATDSSNNTASGASSLMITQ